MDRVIVDKLINNPKLFDHFLHHSYWIKELTRNPNSFKDFENEMKKVYKERITDRLNDAASGIELISSIVDINK